MAIYHARVKTFSRAKGHSSLAAAAYRAGLLILDEITGTRHDYRRRGGVVETRCVVPDDAPEWALTPTELWPAAERAERRKDATVAREFEVALPHELTDEQRSDLAGEITRALVERYRFAAQVSIHSPDAKDGLNWHAHVLATTRRISSDGLAEKTRELDGGPAGRAEIEWVREMVARVTNAHLAAAEVDATVDHRSLDAQAQAALDRGDLGAALALTRQPTKHIGKNASALSRRGMDSDRADVTAGIERENAEQFEALLQQAVAQGRAIPSSEGHGEEQAKRDRQRGRPAAVVDLSQDHGGGQLRGVRGLRLTGVGSYALPPRSEGPDAEVLFGEAMGLWLDDALAGVLDRLRATRQLLEDHASRLATHAGAKGLRPDLRELVKRLKAVRRWAVEWRRRLGVESRALANLGRAERALEEFSEHHPTPGEWSPKEWATRRGRRFAALEQRLNALKRAREAISPEAEADCHDRLESAIIDAEAWSQDLVQRYSVAEDKMAPAFGPIKLLELKTPSSSKAPRLH
ncbi:MobA/MobL family protein [Luteimonas sp. TWI1416]|uniref:MobA/MobL family protein n=1 Tax=unclassified Luteimonas TaxID=2629088 RepID=UPI0032085507